MKVGEDGSFGVHKRSDFRQQTFFQLGRVKKKARKMTALMSLLNRFFRLDAAGTSVRTEVSAGITTFLTMAYIIFVQPAVLSGIMFGLDTGMPFAALVTVTCISAAAATLLMGLLSGYPIAQAPGMGLNFFFVFSAIPAAAAAGSSIPWQTALGVVFLSGVLFVGVTLLGLREALLDAVSPSMKNGIAVGIGLFVTFIGLQNSGLIVKDPGTAVALTPQLISPDMLVFFAGLILSIVLLTRKVRAAILLGIGGATLMAIGLKLSSTLLPASPFFSDTKLASEFTLAWMPVSAPASAAPLFMQLDIAGALVPALWPLSIIFLYMDVFDTMGTLVGVAEQAGFMRNNRLPRVRQAFFADAAATMFGTILGTSTVTSYIESAAGVSEGGRTGLTCVTVAACFLLALFFGPLVGMIGAYAPITAPALVMVGCLMLRNIRNLNWDDPSETLPALLIVIGIPLTYSIADGIMLGFIVYPVAKLLSGKVSEVRPAMFVTAALLLVYVLFVR